MARGRFDQVGPGRWPADSSLRSTPRADGKGPRSAADFGHEDGRWNYFRNAYRKTGSREMTSPLKDLPIGPSSEGQVPIQQYLDVPRVIPACIGGRLSLIPDCDDQAEGMERIRKAIGANSLDFVNEMLVGLAEAGYRGGATRLQKLNFLMSAVTEIKPRDAIQAMLASYIAVVHVRIMKSAASLANADTPKEEEHHQRLLNKGIRTFVLLVDNLKRYRSDQNVIVQSVSIGEGAQAIVANIAQNTQSEQNSEKLQASTDARPVQMPIMHESEDRIFARKKYDWRS